MRADGEVIHARLAAALALRDSGAPKSEYWAALETVQAEFRRFDRDCNVRSGKVRPRGAREEAMAQQAAQERAERREQRKTAAAERAARKAARRVAREERRAAPVVVDVEPVDLDALGASDVVAAA